MSAPSRRTGSLLLLWLLGCVVLLLKSKRLLLCAEISNMLS